MSSRALRRAQKELEERQRAAELAAQEEEDGEEDIVKPAPKPSLFALLGEDQDEPDDDEDDEVDAPGTSPGQDVAPAIDSTASKTSKKGKKKKKKGKGKSKAAAPSSESGHPSASDLNSEMDEIDRALLALNMGPQTQNSTGEDAEASTAQIDDELKQLYSVLSVDTTHLHAANEMRKLFGRAAVQAHPDADEGARRRGHGGAAVPGLVAGRRAGVSLGLRRNIFIQGKEEWPRATTGGLGMVIVSKWADGTVEYRFVHNTAYQSVQRQFETCVEAADPERMIQLLQFNPYHISTLLQVSEIAKQQRDNAAAGDLLERALFSFGRAIHSTFANNLAQGKARLDFRRPENREFWLAAWRYIQILGVRATWRTAFEWTKLLLAMDPKGDPYCLRLSIDQLALRGRDAQALVDIAESDYLQRLWKIPPNLAMSVALAHNQLKNPEKARSTLKLAIQQYPWVAARLCKELDISPIPQPIWGKEPNDDYQELLCQLYVTKAKDLWNTPEATSLLVEVASSCDGIGDGKNPYWLSHYNSIVVARHIILLEDRALMSLLDPSVKAKYTSSSDPLPPPGNLASYSTGALRHQDVQNMTREQASVELYRLRDYFNSIAHVGEADGTIGLEPHQLGRLLEEAGSSLDELRQNTLRFRVLRDRLQELGDSVGYLTDEEDII